MSKFKFVTDAEGVLFPPSLDFAFDSYRELVSKKTKEKFPEELIKTFDEYDDVRWEREREERGHSTGTTPLVIDCVEACDGISDMDLIRSATKVINENPGITELIEFAQDNFGTLFIVTNSYPALTLLTAYTYGVLSSHVFTHGYQLSKKDRKAMNWESLSGEVIKRSPIPELQNEEIEQFLEKYLKNCSDLLQAYKTNNPEKIRELEKGQLELFKKVKDKTLRKTLRYIFVQEKAIMGGHRKVDALRQIDWTGERIIYLGDSIVDADAIKFSRYGFAINCTNKHSLYDAKLNIALSDFSLLIPLLKDISNGRFRFKDAKKYESEEMKVFLPEEIRKNFDYVKSVNSKFKQQLKDLYKI